MSRRRAAGPASAAARHFARRGAHASTSAHPGKPARFALPRPMPRQLRGAARHDHRPPSRDEAP